MPAESNAYIIPFGLDGTKFFEGLNNIDKGTDATAANVQDAGRAMQKSFNDAGAAGEKLGDTIKKDGEKLNQLKEQARSLGRDLGAALSGKSSSGDFEKKLANFQALMQKASGSSKGLNFNIDTAKLEYFEKLIEEGANDLQILNQVIDFSRQKLSTLDPDSEEFKELNQQLQIADEFLKGVADSSEQLTGKQKTLKGELREIKAQMAELELAGKGNTEEFRNLALRAGELEDQMGDVSQRVRVLASDTKYLDAGIQAIQALAGGFAAAQGAVALFGEESEEMNRVLQKVTGAMAVLQGIQAVANALNKDSALSVLLFSNAQKAATTATTAKAAATVTETGATVAATAATKGFTAALLANPMGLIIIAIAAVISALIAFTSSSSEAEEATEDLNDALESQNRLLKLNENSINRRSELLAAQAKAAGKSESEITKIEGQGLAERINLQKSALAEFTKFYNDQDLRRKLSAEENKKLEDDLIERQENISDLENELQIKRLDFQTQKAKEENELTKKQIEAAKKAAEERKKIVEQELKFARELAAARLEAMAEGADKERAEVRNRINGQIEQLNAEKALSAKAEKEKAELITQLRENLRIEISRIDEKEAKERAALQFAAAKATIEMREDGIVKEVELLRYSYLERRKEIEDQFKDEKDLRNELLAQLNDAQIRETKNLTDAAAQERLKKQEEIAVLEVETASRYLMDLPGIEEQKQIEILRVKLDYAQDALDLLKSQGKAENDLAVLQAKKAVQDLRQTLNNAVEEAAAQGAGLDWFDMLGLGSLSEDQRTKVVDAAKQALQSIREITGFIIDQYQRQIDKKQEVIDQIDTDIDDLEDKLDKERDLREKGFANNVETLEAELAAKKQAREDEVKQQEEIQAKQRALAKLQLVVDTAVQASNLITASTKIFNTLSAIPFVGIPLAIATIALMTGAFVAAKVKAFQLVNDQKQSFAGGGLIDGKPHSQGGRKYRAIDGGGVVELESGEHVTNKHSTKKYYPLLEAINNDELGGMNDDALRVMLEELGIAMSAEAPVKALNIVREYEVNKTAYLAAPTPLFSNDIEQINKGVQLLAEAEKNRTDRWADDKYFYEKVGNTTTRIPKK